MSLANALQDQAEQRSRIEGILIGIVTENEDPEGRGRVKVKYPRLSDTPSDWVPVASFAAGPERGAFFHPEVDDEVLVAFEYGDINSPYIIGRVWNGQDTPPVDQAEQLNVRRIKTKSGHTITLNDTEGEEQIQIVDSKANSITIDTTSQTIKIEAQQDIELKAVGKVSISAAEIQIKAEATASVEAGASLSLQAEGELTAKGAMINLN